MGVALALAGLVTMIVAVIGLARGRVNWARLRKRQHAALALAAGLVLFVTGGALAPAQKQSPAANSTLTTKSPSSTPAPSRGEQIAAPSAPLVETPSSSAAAQPVQTTPALPPPVAQPVQTTPPAPPARPVAATCGAPANPDGYNFCGRGGLIYTFPSDFCDYFDCIASYPNGTGYIDECSDETYSHSGGRPGACSHHGGELRPVDAGP